MFRLTSVSLVALAITGVAGAAQIQIGGPSGLTGNYITQGSGAVCAAGAGNCVTGSTTGWTERNYNSLLFVGSSNTAPATPSAFTGYVQTGLIPSGNTLTGSVTFAMIAEPSGSGNSKNIWGAGGSTSTSPANSTIVVPIGVSGVTDVWTMLNNVWGVAGSQDTTLDFYFGAGSNSTAGLTDVTVRLLNSSNSESGTGQIRASVGCNAGCLDNGPQSQVAVGPLAALTSNIGGSGVDVTTELLYTFTYNAGAAGTSYTGTSGNLRLDDQGFHFGNTYVGEYLVKIGVTQNAGCFGCSSGTALSETALSAITVTSVAPEPSTIFLVLSGIGVLGFRRFRRG